MEEKVPGNRCIIVRDVFFNPVIKVNISTTAKNCMVEIIMVLNSMILVAGCSRGQLIE